MSRYSYPSVLPAFICLLLYCSSGLANVAAPAHSPEAHTELICHTSHASECYPAVFQPTEYFQRVHDDQSIPPGLHVRLNLATGLKEARLNVPEPEDAPKADLVLIDNPPEAHKVDVQAPLMPDIKSQRVESQVVDSQNHDPRKEGPFQSDVHTQPKFEEHEYFEDDIPSVPNDEANESEFFSRQMAIVNFKNPTIPTNIQNILSAIEHLTSLAHDLEWGIALTRNAPLSRLLMKYIILQSLAPLEIRSASAQLLGTAIQNNAEALEALMSQFGDLEGYRYTPIIAVHIALRDSMLWEEQDTVFQTRLLFLLANLSPSLPQLETFVSSGGLTDLHGLFLGTEMDPGVDGRDKIRMKVANYVQDYVISTIDGWPSHSLVDSIPSGTSPEIFESQLIWKKALRGMGTWCRAFELAFEKYDTAAEAPGGAPKEVDNAYTSIYESREMLGRVLRNQGCKGDCACDFDKIFAE